MRIICRKAISWTTKEDLGDSSPWVKVGKEYIVLAVLMNPNLGILVLIQTENYDEPMLMSLDGFEVISQKIPSNWISHISESGTFYMLPAKWAYEDFWGELEDEKENAVNLFIEEARVTYREEGVTWG